MHQEKDTSTSIILRREAVVAPSGEATFRAHVVLLVATALLFGAITGMAVTWHIKPQYYVTVLQQRAVPLVPCPVPSTEARVIFIESAPPPPSAGPLAPAPPVPPSSHQQAH